MDMMTRTVKDVSVRTGTDSVAKICSTTATTSVGTAPTADVVVDSTDNDNGARLTVFAIRVVMKQEQRGEASIFLTRGGLG